VLQLYILSSQVSCFQRIWQSIRPFDTELFRCLLEQLEPLRCHIDTTSSSTVDLINPTLYPLLYQKTLVSHLNGRRLHPIDAPPSPDVYSSSRHYAMLPSDVFVRPNGTVKILSYINNLNPTHHQNIYTSLQTSLGFLIPLFERCLTDLHRNNPITQRITGQYKYTVWEEPDTPEHSDDEEGWAAYEHAIRNWTLHRDIHLPDVPNDGYRGGLEHRKHRVTLRDRAVQVIFRISESTVVSTPSYKHSSTNNR